MLVIEIVWLADVEKVMLVLTDSVCVGDSVVDDEEVLVPRVDTDVETVILALDVAVWIED